MKKLFFFYSFLFVNLIQSQEFQTHKLLPPESKSYSDLGFLDDELQGKRIVMLGEITHMYGDVFEMKARIVEYLHSKLGYTTIAMESSMYDLWLVNKKKFNSKDFNNAIWGVWSNSIEFQRLVKYIERNELKVIGFDSQFNNNISKFIENLLDYLETQKIEVKLNEDDFVIIIEGVLDNVTFDETDIKF